jgi:HSP20 family protein
MFYAPRVYSPATLLRFAWLADACAPRSTSGALDINAEQDDKSLTLRLDVPGLAKEHLSIGIDGKVVRIQSKDDAPRRYQAAYRLAQEVDAAASQAKLENGVLTLKLAKVQPVDKTAYLVIN